MIAGPELLQRTYARPPVGWPGRDRADGRAGDPVSLFRRRGLGVVFDWGVGGEDAAVGCGDLERRIRQEFRSPPRLVKQVVMPNAE